MRVSSRLILLVGAATVLSAAAVGTIVDKCDAAQADDPVPAEPPIKAPSVPHKPKLTPKPKVKVEGSTAPAPASPTPPVPAQVIVSQRLISEGAGCIGRIEGIAQTALAGTKAFVPVSGWHPDAPKQHLTSVVVGQTYAQGYGLTGIIAAPSTTGGNGCTLVSFRTEY